MHPARRSGRKRLPGRRPGACSSAQIGLLTAIGQAPIHFSKAPAGCPDAAKLGTFEAASPLLAQRNEAHKVILDPEGNPIPEPLQGSVYLAKPFDNPFNSLIAVYFAIDDPRTGIVAKLAGKVEPDPESGQLRVSVEENPELPLEDIRVHLFGGSRAAADSADLRVPSPPMPRSRPGPRPKASR